MPRYTAQVYIVTSATVEAETEEEAERLFKLAEQDNPRLNVADLKCSYAAGVVFDEDTSINEITGIQQEDA